MPPSKRALRQQMTDGGGAAALPAMTMHDLDMMLYGGGSGGAPVVAASSVVRHDDGTIEVAGFTLTGVGLTGGETSSHEDWMTVGRVLRKLENGLQWLIGDWVLKTKPEWGDTYAWAEELGFALPTLWDYVYVCRSVQISVRTEILSFGHHKLVAGIPDAKTQREWLERAEAEGWSVAAMRAAMRGQRTPTLPDGSKDYDKIRETEAFDAVKGLRGVKNKLGKMTREERMTAAASAAKARAYFEELENLLYRRNQEDAQR